jgi:8-oxo-dGTP pyrophosphatase MutT (NUDIX family)
VNIVAPLFRWLYTLDVRRDPATRRPLQVGAVPWCRRAGSKLEVLLITSRRSGKWIVPRGWTSRLRRLPRSAKREALEEAGVRGFISREPIGHVDLPKDYRLAGTIQWRLALFSLEVTDVLETWKETGQRQRQWFSPEEAAKLVSPPEVGALILELAAAKQRQPSSGGEQGGAGLFFAPPTQEAEPERGERRHDHADLGAAG